MDNQDFINKILYSLVEFNFFSVDQINTKSDINKTWRAYEAYVGIVTFNDFNLINKLIGGGIGTVSFLDIDIALKGIKYDYIFIWHIAFVTLLVKGGLIGLFIIIGFLTTHFLNLVKLKNSKNKLYLPGIVSFFLILTFISSQGWFSPNFYLVNFLLGYSFFIDSI